MVWGSGQARATEQVVFTDVRFRNEADAIREAKGATKVKRPGVGPVNDHESERFAETVIADVTIDNDGDLEKLAERARSAYQLVGPVPF